MEDPVVHHERNLCGHPLAGLLWEKQFEKVLSENCWEKVPNWECFFVKQEKKTILVCIRGRHKIGWEETERRPIWKIRTKDVDLGEPTSFIDHVYSGCTQRECQISKDIVDNYRSMFGYLVQGNLTQTSLDGPVIWKVMQRNVEKDVADWRTKQHSNCTNLATPCIDDHQVKEEELGSVGEYQKYALELFVLKCLYLARIGRPDILWSVNKFARAVTKWTRACDKRWARLISYIHHTSEFKQHCHVGSSARQCRLGLFQDSDFARDLEDAKSTSGGILCIFGSHTFVPISWMCKKQTAVSHSSTESEVISLEAGLRMDGIPALDLWDLVLEVLHSSSNHSKKSQENVQRNLLRDTSSSKYTNIQTKNSIQYNYFELCNVGYVSSNVKSSQSGAMLYIFEDNEAVIKMTITGRSPTMRHVSQTHRVALDWLFGRINQDSQNSIKYVDIKHQCSKEQEKRVLWQSRSRR